MMSLGHWIVGHREFFPTFRIKPNGRKDTNWGGWGRWWAGEGTSPDHDRRSSLWPRAGVGRAVQVKAVQAAPEQLAGGRRSRAQFHEGLDPGRRGRVSSSPS